MPTNTPSSTENTTEADAAVITSLDSAIAAYTAELEQIEPRVVTLKARIKTLTSARKAMTETPKRRGRKPRAAAAPAPDAS